MAFANNCDVFDALFSGLYRDNSLTRQVYCEKVTTPAMLSMIQAKACQLIDRLSTVSVTSPMSL